MQQKLALPTVEETEKLIKKFHVPLHVIKHSIIVNFISMYIANEFVRLKIIDEFNLELVDRASILHDLFRIVDFNDFMSQNFEQTITEEDRNMWKFLRLKYFGIRHPDAAYDYFKKDYPDMANTILKHKFSMVGELFQWEEKIVFYADKRVDNYNFVDLGKRFMLGEIRHKKSIEKKQLPNEKIRKIKQKIAKLEKDIFKKLNKRPEYLKEYVVDFVNNIHRNPNKSIIYFNDWRKLLGIKLDL